MGQIPKKKILYILLIIIELIIIATVGFTIIKAKNQKFHLSPINKESLVFPDGDLKYFFEPEPNTVNKGNEWVPYKAEYTINSDSLNEVRDYPTEKDGGTYRIITLGDSYTFGLYVNTKDNWSKQLEDKLATAPICPKYKKYEVINLGMQGYDTQYELHRFTTRGIKYSPDLVVWFLKNDDFIQLNEIMLPLEKEYNKKMKESGEFDSEVAKGNFYPSWNKANKEFTSKYPEDQVLTQQKIFITDLIEKNPGKTLLMTFNQTEAKYKKILEDFANKNPVKALFFDGIPNIHAQKELRFEDDGHPTVLGHTKIMESLYNYIKYKNIDCN